MGDGYSSSDHVGMGFSYAAIDSSNVGFQLLKKCGWKEGTGLGISQQGRLEPLQAEVKKNKRGLGAEKMMKKTKGGNEDCAVEEKIEKEHMQNKPKRASKRMRKVLEEEKRMKEQEFEKAFFREFWPDNV